MDLFGEKKDLLLNQLTLCLSIGDRMRQLRRYDDAIVFYDMAIEAMEGEEGAGVQPLIARSKAYSALPNHRAAREDAETAIKKEPNNQNAIENNAFTLYGMDRFEEALVEYHRGLRIRQKPDNFANGILVATETVEDCVGRNAGSMMENQYLGDTILRIWLNDQNLLQPYIIPVTRNPAREQIRNDLKERFFGEKYLQRLNHDKQFLLRCAGSSQLYSGNVESYVQLKGLLTDALTQVNRRQKTLRRLRPMYTYKMKDPTKHISSKKFKELDHKEQLAQLDITRLALGMLQKACTAQMQHSTLECLSYANRAKEFVLSQPSRLIYEKSIFIKRVYKIIGDLYLGMKEFIPDWTQDENDLRILYMMGVKVGNDNEEEHLRGSFMPYIYDPRKLLEDSEREMSLATGVLERVYLYHEMGRSLNQLGNTEQARSMCRRCAQEARTIKANEWIINGMFMVARCESIQRNYVDAKNTISEAIEVAKTLSSAIWTDFLTRVLQLLDFAGSLESDRNILLRKREKDMLDAMPTRYMKMTMSHIFNLMSRLPANRRMMLVPGIPQGTSKKSKSKTKKLGQVSIAVPRGNVKLRRRQNAKNPEMVRSLDPRLKKTVSSSVCN